MQLTSPLLDLTIKAAFAADLLDIRCIRMLGDSCEDSAPLMPAGYATSFCHRGTNPLCANNIDCWCMLHAASVLLELYLETSSVYRWYPRVFLP